MLSCFVVQKTNVLRCFSQVVFHFVVFPWHRFPEYRGVCVTTNVNVACNVLYCLCRVILHRKLLSIELVAFIGGRCEVSRCLCQVQCRCQTLNIEVFFVVRCGVGHAVHDGNILCYSNGDVSCALYYGLVLVQYSPASTVIKFDGWYSANYKSVGTDCRGAPLCGSLAYIGKMWSELLDVQGCCRLCVCVCVCVTSLSFVRR